MKKINLITTISLLSSVLTAQNNSFPTSGNVGIGNSSPAAKVEIDLGNTYYTRPSGFRLSTPFPVMGQGGPGTDILTSIFELRNETALGSYKTQFMMNRNGNVGIGVPYTEPRLTSTKLVVADNDINKVDANVQGFLLLNGKNASLLLGGQDGTTYGQWGIEYNEFASTKGLNFWKPSGSNNTGNYVMFLTDDGKVSIGLDPNLASTYKGNYKLYVAEGILTERVKVALKTSAEWADYVFNKEYHLMPLQQVENFISTKGHLPNVPSADEVVEQGIDMAKMDAKLLEKIEELTLYMIQLNKQNEQLKVEVEILKKEINSNK